MFLGLIIAIFLDQKIRIELLGLFIYINGTFINRNWNSLEMDVKSWIRFEAVIKNLGFNNFTFDWLINPDFAIYTVVIAGVWQASGFVMALFLAGLRSVVKSN